VFRENGGKSAVLLGTATEKSDFDMFDKRFINHGPRSENEIFSTGTVIYGDKAINQIKEEINNN